MKETTYWQRTDSFDEKVRLLTEAYRSKDYRVARSIGDSLRHSLTLEQQQQAPLGEAVLAADSDILVADLPAPWREWARGWSYVRVLALDETANLARSGEPIEIDVSFPEDRVSSLRREVRSQVDEEVRRDGERQCRLTFFANAPAHQRSYWLVFYGNPDAELPRYPTDLEVNGEGFQLDF